jgi:CPA1 family monovalent cation:H+ antiporter
VSVYQLAALLLAIIGPVLAIAGHLKAPTSLVLFALGLGSAYLPGLPPVAVDPDLPLNLFLPPLIYASAVRVSWLLLRFTLVPGVVLGAVLIVANVTVVALALKLFLLPGLVVGRCRVHRRGHVHLRHQAVPRSQGAPARAARHLRHAEDA